MATTTARLLVLWDRPDDAAGFDRHYRDVHVPLARTMPGLRRYTLSRNVVAIRGGDPCYLMAELDFDDMASLRKSFESAAGQATAADVANLAATGARAHSMIYELEDVVAEQG
jgi:uncharacterized protein (TIGR02118 family)